MATGCSTNGPCLSPATAAPTNANCVSARKGAEHALAAQQEAEQQLRGLNDALSDADRRKDEFLATLSHELRNPLAPMRSALEVLKLGRADGPPPARLLAVFDRQLHHLTHLVDDLMDISRITQNRMELRRGPIGLAAILHSAAHDAAPQMTAAGHTLNVTLPEPDVIVDADVTRMTQVVVNLLTNAAKYTPDGGTIALRCWQEDGQAFIEVRDNGIGIPAHALDSVFGMFSQLKPALDRAKGGLGIGLALVRGILALHGGGIGADSEGEGLGSVFTVRLPLAIAPAQAPAAPSAAEPMDARRVLIVDDNEDAAATLVMVMELYGCTARAVHTRAGGAGSARRLRPPGGPVRHRPARHERLRTGTARAPAAGRRRPAAGGGHWLGAGIGQAAGVRGGVRSSPHQADRFRQVAGVIGRAAGVNNASTGHDTSPFCFTIGSRVPVHSLINE